MVNKWDDNNETWDILRDKYNNVVGTDWVNLTLEAGYIASSEGTHPPQYKIKDDIVYLRGAVDVTTNSAYLTFDPIAILPIGYRPSQLIIKPILHFDETSGLTAVEVRSNGYIATGNAGFDNVSLEGVSFSIEP